MKTVYVVLKDEYIGHGDWNTVVDSVYEKKADAQAHVKQFPEYEPGKTRDIYHIAEWPVQ